VRLLELGRSEEASLHVADRAVDGAEAELAALAQGVGDGLQEGVAVGDVERPAGGVDRVHLVVGELDRRHGQNLNLKMMLVCA
jgi:hypothetical protein